MEPMEPLPRHSAYKFLPQTTSHPSQPAPPFKIKHTSTWTYSGPVLTPSSLPTSLHTWLNSATTSPPAFLQHLHPLLFFLHAFLLKHGITHYWLTLRATQPTPEYDAPRWHVDDDFFGARDGSADPVSGTKSRAEQSKGGWKLCTTLLGPSTLFLSPERNDAALEMLHATKRKEAASREHACTSMRCAGCFDTGAAVRASLASLFAAEDTVQAPAGTVVVFRTGAAGAVHSEPRCDGERIFVNVVPGTEDGLRALMGRFGMGFPRAWSLGVPVCVEDGEDGLAGVVSG